MFHGIGYKFNATLVAYFIICATITAVVGFQALTGSHFGFIEKKKSVLSSYIIFIILGSILLFLYLGTQQFMVAGEITVDGVFWLALAFLLVGLCGLVGNLKNK
ncbi:hypothetical protein [Enterococcus nangangensis]|uniref:hypothetical protein n=1 Tax=Enterococcus nangangensis TaxID=2559926 RepID=UPI00148546EC|nr:hypothetical protein [Enterococcus nangangensis]